VTFADVAEKCGGGDSGHSQVVITDLGMVPAERLHLKAVYSLCRPRGTEQQLRFLAQQWALGISSNGVARQ